MKDIKKSKYFQELIKFTTNFDIIRIFPDAKDKIKTFSELGNYKDIYELMPNKVDYVFLLTESEKNKGHWTLLLRRNNYFEYFDSYGHSPKQILSFTPKFMNQFLGNDWNEDLGKMLKSIVPPQIPFRNYSKKAFQNINIEEIATCGRWCIHRLYLFLMDGITNTEFEKIMKQHYIKMKSKLSYDEIICQIINI